MKTFNRFCEEINSADSGFQKAQAMADKRAEQTRVKKAVSSTAKSRKVDPNVAMEIAAAADNARGQ